MRSKGVFNAFPKFFRLEATNHSHHQNLGSWGVLFLGEMGILTSDCSQKKWQSSHKKILAKFDKQDTKAHTTI
jgi:hypothetical protein